MKQCRSIKRAMRRGHPVNLNGTYKSKRESRIIREIYEAALRKQAQEAQKENNNGQES